MTLEELNAAESALDAWNRTADPTAENFRKYADALEKIVAGKAALKAVKKQAAAAYMTQIAAYRHNADSLENMKNETIW